MVCRSSGTRVTAVFAAFLAGSMVLAGCSATGAGGNQVRAILSTEDAQDILPGPEGNFVVLIHLDSDGSTIPFVMQTPRQVTPYAAYLAADEPVFIVDVPGDQIQPLIDAELDWQDAIISSGSRLKPDLLATTAGLLVTDARIPGSIMQVDASIAALTRNDPAHMAGAYLIRGDTCIAVVARQASGSDWLLTAIPDWTGMAAVREVSSSAGALILSDSTTLTPSRLETCKPGA